MNELIITLGLIWVAMVIVVYLHEIGHMGENIKVKLGVIPIGASIRSKYSWGGLAVNLLLAWGIFYYMPENVLLQYIGLVSWIHFILYVIFGSFNPEISHKRLIVLNYLMPQKVSRFLKWYVFDDVPNELWFIYVPLGIIVFWTMKGFYLPIINEIWQIILSALGV